ncbi:hypothetical protein [Mycoplasma putrefaciens]|uniref:ATP synthase epsilon chain n=2 Tax=Mycoplasma putrefaciens TaxID=2123 RepID=M9WAN2_9MOLU|nr:hypothetical protein [Mycoplasma putrefaciens]AEM68485.1 ATP synthase F1 epsilon subunit [Mycoplasma putrefaciens KS1]AGJ91053.1 ATP synthase epsilon chain [Mycoplasma putrefaciens Mput9231]SYV94980.1 ATP synthase F1 epsilon subunit [Mycoplasma putrefaciens]
MSIKLKIVTPNGIFIDSKEVEIINVKTIDGDMGILKNMAPFTTALKISQLNFRTNTKTTYLHINGGIMEVTQQECKIITEGLNLVDQHGNILSTPDKFE